MNRFRLFILTILFCISVLMPIFPAHAGGDPLFKDSPVTLSADTAAPVAFDARALQGTAAYVLYVYSTVDTAVTISIDMPLGASGSVNLMPSTEIDATEGHKYKFTTAWPLVQAPTYSVSGLGSGQLFMVMVGGAK